MLFSLHTGGVFLAQLTRDAVATEALYRTDLSTLIGTHATAASVHLSAALLTSNTTDRDHHRVEAIEEHLNEMIIEIDNLLHGSDQGFDGGDTLDAISSDIPEYHLLTGDVCDEMEDFLKLSEAHIGGSMHHLSIVDNCTTFDEGHFLHGCGQGYSATRSWSS
jgi:hypothetical protein